MEDTEALFDMEDPKCNQCQHWHHGFCVEMDAIVEGSQTCCQRFENKSEPCKVPSYTKLR